MTFSNSLHVSVSVYRVGLHQKVFKPFKYSSYEIMWHIYSSLSPSLHFHFILLPAAKTSPFQSTKNLYPHYSGIRVQNIQLVVIIHILDARDTQTFYFLWNHLFCRVCALTAVERNNLMRLANTIPFTPVSMLGNFLFGHLTSNLITSRIYLQLFGNAVFFLYCFLLSLQEVKRSASTLWRKCPQSLTLNPTQSPPGHHEACLPCCSPSSAKRALWMEVSGRAAGCCVPGQNRMRSDRVWYTWSKPSGQKWFVPGRGTSMAAQRCSFV